MQASGVYVLTEQKGGRKLGFVNATCELGTLFCSDSDDSDSSGIDNFLQLPMPVIEDDTRSGRVIRVWLNVKDKDANCLEITRIEKIDSAGYIRTNDPKKLMAEKRKYIYKDPTGAATPWKFSPVYKLGKGNANAIKELLGEEGSWKDHPNTRFYKLHRTVLNDFEKCNAFYEGSTSLIMEELESNIERLGELWSDKKRSYLVVFGINNDGSFLYPGQIPVFRNYFRSKLAENMGSDIPVVCSICNSQSKAGANLDKVFKFATFDKSNFLPGARNGKGVCEKVFPICEKCLSSLSMGREILDRSFLDRKTIHGISIYVVPELLFGQKYLQTASSQTQNFIKEGLGTSERFFNILARQDNSLIYHFLFWEKNQAQERLHLMVEDVPPSRLKRLENLWRNTYKNFLWNRKKEPDFAPQTITLDNALKTIYFVLTSLSGKNENDRDLIKDRVIGIIGKLLGNEIVDIGSIKQLIVSRLPGLFADEEWLRFGGYELRKMIAITEFLLKANRR